MKKRVIYLFIALTLLSISLLTLPSKVSAQSDNITVLSYSYQIDPSSGTLIVYGELQNTGTSTLQNVMLSGSVYSSDGTDQSDSPGNAYSIYIVPGQKIPFEIDFPNGPNSGGPWSLSSISRIDFTTDQANVTNSYPYPYVKIISQTSYIDTTTAAQGTYWVTGSLKNTGNQTAQEVYVIATFYNSSGSAVSAGWSTVINIMAPLTSASFQVGAFDLNMSEATPSQQIASYALAVRPGTPILQGTPPDAAVYSTVAASSTQQSSSSSATPSSTGLSSGNKTSNSISNQSLIYVAIIILVIIAVVIAIVTFPKRKSAEYAKAKRKSTAQRSKKLTARNLEEKFALHCVIV